MSSALDDLPAVCIGLCYMKCLANFAISTRTDLSSFVQPSLEIFLDRCSPRGPDFYKQLYVLPSAYFPAVQNWLCVCVLISKPSSGQSSVHSQLYVDAFTEDNESKSIQTWDSLELGYIHIVTTSNLLIPM